jgi:hypothetical protein
MLKFSRNSIAAKIRLLLLLAFALLACGIYTPTASAGPTYVVGTCKTGLRSFSTISTALAAIPSPTIVMVCPGSYSEQVIITFPVTLEGIATSLTDMAVIEPPSGAFIMANTLLGVEVAPQLWVNNVSGPVDITNIAIDGREADVSGLLAGIFFQNSSGTINQVATRNQDTSGFGVWLEGGSANPTVTLEDSSIHDFSDVGIFIEGELTATAKSNSVNDVSSTGIEIESPAKFEVTNNVVVAFASETQGIVAADGAAGSISNNTVLNASTGIVAQGGISVTGNKLYNNNTGIQMSGEPIVTGNTITNSFIAIDFGCADDSNVHSNTISDATNGIDGVPAGITTANNFHNVLSLREACGDVSTAKAKKTN